MKKKSKKATKLKKKSKKITKSAKALISEKKSLIEPLEPQLINPEMSLQSGVSTVEKLPWEIMNEGFDFFNYAFQPDGFEDKDGNYIVDDRFVAMWKTFLTISGWNEDEFWAYTHEHENGECPECKKEREEAEELEITKKTKNMN